MDLEEMLIELSKGRIYALDEIYVKTKKSVYVSVYLIVKHEQATEDIMHDVYLSIVKNIGKYKPKGTPMAWIFRIAKNLALNYIRNNKKFAALPSDPGSAAPETDRESAYDVIDTAAKVLDDTEFEIVMLRIVADLPHKEIAEYLKIPYATVRWKYSNAIDKIKNRLEAETN